MQTAKQNATNKNTAVLTIDDMARIKEQCHFSKADAEQEEKERIKQLQEKSK
jgi:hypothetical protein